MYVREQATLVFAEMDPSYNFLMTNAKGIVMKLIKNHKLSIETLKNADHTFSSRSIRYEFIECMTRHFIKRYM